MQKLGVSPNQIVEINLPNYTHWKQTSASQQNVGDNTQDDVDEGNEKEKEVLFEFGSSRSDNVNPTDLSVS